MKNSPIFLDSNFIIANQIEGHKFYERTQELRSEWELNGERICISPIVLDEVLYVCKGIMVQGGLEKTEVYKKLEEIIENIFQFANLEVLELDTGKKDWLKIVGIMKEETLRPRDAIIAHMMKVNDIGVIASFDTRFDGIVGVERCYK